jgi:hypothetical protein
VDQDDMYQEGQSGIGKGIVVGIVVGSFMWSAIIGVIVMGLR